MRRVLAILASLAGGCHHPPPAGAPEATPGPPGDDRVTVEAVSERPPPSGYLATFVELRVRDARGAADSYVLPYISEQGVPPVGARCRLTYHRGEVRGLVGKLERTIADAKIVDRLDCS